MLGDEPLSPYFDMRIYAIEMATKELKAIYKKQRNKKDKVTSATITVFFFRRE